MTSHRNTLEYNKLGAKAGDIKVKMRGADLVEIEVKNVDPPLIKEKIRK